MKGKSAPKKSTKKPPSKKMPKGMKAYGGKKC